MTRFKDMLAKERSRRADIFLRKKARKQVQKEREEFGERIEPITKKRRKGKRKSPFGKIKRQSLIEGGFF